VNVSGYAAVERDDIHQSRSVVFEASNDGVVRALGDAHDAALEAARCLALDPNEDAVAVHRLGEICRGNVDVLSIARLAVVGHDESKAGRIGVETSGDEVFGIRQGEPIAANLRKLTGNHETLEIALERHAFVARHPQLSREFARRSRMDNVFFEEGQNLFW
jgi:hypothetical protein